MLPNSLVRSYLLALAELVGKNGLNTILNVSGLSEWIENYPPEDEITAVRFESFARIQAVLEDLYGERAGQNLSKRAAKKSFRDAGKKLLGVNTGSAEAHDSFKLQIQAFVDLFNEEDVKDVTWESSERDIIVNFERCPDCLSIESPTPTCFACVGWIEALFELIGTGEQLEVTETACLAAGDSSCSFVIRAM
jgi:predicted hydrocarbon binding protein